MSGPPVKDRSDAQRSRRRAAASRTTPSLPTSGQRSAARLIELVRRGRTAAEIATVLNVRAEAVQSLIDELRDNGTLPGALSGDRIEGDFLALLETTELTPARAAKQAGLSPNDVKALIERLGSEDRLTPELASRATRRAGEPGRPAGADARRGQASTLNDARSGEPSPTARTNPRALGGPQPKLDEARTREAHERIKLKGERTADVAASLGVSVRTLFKYFATYDLSVGKTDPKICKRALREAQVANHGQRVSWRTYLELRRSYPAWPTPTTIVRELKAKDWPDAQRIARVKYQ